MGELPSLRANRPAAFRGSSFLLHSLFCQRLCLMDASRVSVRCGGDEQTQFQQPVGGGVSGAGSGASFRSNAKWMIRHTTPTLIAESATLNAGQ